MPTGAPADRPAPGADGADDALRSRSCAPDRGGRTHPTRRRRPLRAAIAAREPDIGAFITLDLDGARRAAAMRLRASARGFTVGMKDIYDTADAPTEYGSTVYQATGRGPTPRPSAMIRRAGGHPGQDRHHRVRSPPAGRQAEPAQFGAHAGRLFVRLGRRRCRRHGAGRYRPQTGGSVIGPPPIAASRASSRPTS